MPDPLNFYDKIRNIIDDKHTVEVFEGLTDDYTHQLPFVSDSHGRSFLFTNYTDYDVTLALKGSDTVNGYSTDIVMNQNGGMWWLFAGETEWIARSDGNATIYSVESETAYTGLPLDGTWGDVSGMQLLNEIYGLGWLSAQGNHTYVDSSLPSYLHGKFGLGKTSGNNAPDIPGGADWGDYIQNIANSITGRIADRNILPFLYESDGSTIYMKAQAVSDEMNITAHYMKGLADKPMGIWWRRIA